MLLHGLCFHLIYSYRRSDFYAHGPIHLLDHGIHHKVCTILVRNANSAHLPAMWAVIHSSHVESGGKSKWNFHCRDHSTANHVCLYECLSDEKIKLWLFLPGRHSSVVEKAQAAVSRLRGSIYSRVSIALICFDFHFCNGSGRLCMSTLFLIQLLFSFTSIFLFLQYIYGICVNGVWYYY